MEKKKSHAFGKDTYLLGKGKDGNYYWLEEGKWDCNWYWGIGYVKTYKDILNPNMAKDISSHQHWDGLFPTYDKFNDFFEETVLNDKEKWKLLELMKAIYIARHYSDMLYIGGAHYTNNPCKEDIHNEDEYNRINKVMIPKMLEKVYEILSN
jgi:hypothetical protein